MIHEARQVMDARRQSAPVVITTVPPQSASAAVTRYVRPARVVETTPARVLGQPAALPRPRNRVRLAVLVAGGALADVAVLGTAGVLFAQSEAGHQLAALVLLVLAVAGGALLVALSRGRVHCPGCPR